MLFFSCHRPCLDLGQQLENFPTTFIFWSKSPIDGLATGRKVQLVSRVFIHLISQSCGFWGQLIDYIDQESILSRFLSFVRLKLRLRLRLRLKLRLKLKLRPKLRLKISKCLFSYEMINVIDRELICSRFRCFCET